MPKPLSKLRVPVIRHRQDTILYAKSFAEVISHFVVGQLHHPPIQILAVKDLLPRLLAKKTSSKTKLAFPLVRPIIAEILF